jgi:sulfide:quinone oxidoreductase
MAVHVLIVGGGDGGTILANSLDPRRFAVTVLTASLEHVFQRGYLGVAFQGRRRNLVRDEHSLLRSHVTLVHDAAVRIDLVAHEVETTSGKRLGYDEIVIATGVRTDPSRIPGLAEVNERVGDFHSTTANARRLWRNLNAFSGGTVALGQASPIIKCPPSPVEGILGVDARLRVRGVRGASRLVLFTPYPRAYPAEPINEVIAPILEEQGIEVMPFFDVDRIDPATGTIASLEGDEVRADLPIIVPPFVGASIAYEPADVVDDNGLVKTNKETLAVEGVEHAWCIGDANNVPTSKAGVGAHLEAKVVAKTLAGRPTRFNGRTNCSLEIVGERRLTFVIGSFDAPVEKLRPTRVRYLEEWLLGQTFFWGLRGWLDPIFDIYFRLTEPKPRREAA